MRCRLSAVLTALMLNLLVMSPIWGQGLVIVDLPEREADRIVILPRPQPTPMPMPRVASLQLKEHQVTVTIKDQVATTRIEHVFHNPSGARLEGTFMFPLPGNVAIDKFEMDVNGKMTEAELLDAAKARKIYEDIVRSMQDPALLEYVDAGMLKARVFPIEPKSDKRVTLVYTQLLKSDSGVVEYVYPITGRSMQHARTEKLALKLTLTTKEPLANVYCPSHAVEIKRVGDHQAIVGYESEELGEGDLKLYFSPKQSPGDVGLTLLTYRDGGADVLGSDDGYFMLLASPSLADHNRKPVAKDVVFVLDTSGSMQGKKLVQAKKALSFCIENLNDEDRFQIIRFSTDVEMLFKSLRKADADSRQQANAFIDALKPIGGTAIEEALEQALLQQMQVEADAPNARPNYVIFLTDGKPTIGQTDTDRLIDKSIRQNKLAKTTRVFCFGIGTDINTKLLDRISEQTRAVTEYVLPDEDIEVKVSRFYTKISEPVFTAPALSLSVRPAARVPNPSQLRATYPTDLPDLFKGDQVVIVGRYKDPSAHMLIHLTGQVAGQPQTVTIDANLAEKSVEHAFIPRLWATRRIGYLLDEIRLRGESDELKHEVVELARAFGVVTPYTSYLIVEDEAIRDVPMARRSLQEVGRSADLRQRAQESYRAMADAEVGEASVRGAQSNTALKSAASAPAAAQRANDFAFLADGSSTGGATPRDAVQATVFRNGKTFVRNDAQWVDTEAQHARHAGRTAERVAFNSTRYFELIAESKDAAQWLSVGPDMQVVMGDRLIEIVSQ